jgi:Tol biopolymer transport system component
MRSDPFERRRSHATATSVALCRMSQHNVVTRRTRKMNPMVGIAKDRLDSWKEVSAYLGRSVRTLQRWEATAGLPVHRLAHEKRGSIYASKQELDAWWNSRGVKLQAGDGHSVAPPTKRKLVGVLSGVGILVVAGVAVWRSSRDPRPQNSAVVLPFTTLPGTELFPSFSPDGRRVVFTWQRSGHNSRDIYVKAVGAGEPLQLTAHPGREAYPTFSPDSRWVAFRRLNDASGRMEIFVVADSGGSERKIGDVSPFGPLELHSPFLAWTPDGKWLILPDRPRSAEPVALFLMSVVSGEKRRLTQPPEKAFGDFNPAVSRDGRALAFIRMTALGTSAILRQEFTDNFAADGEPVALTAPTPELQNPMWTADQREILYVAGTAGVRELWRVSAFGGGKPQHVDSPGRIGIHLSLSPEGSSMIYSDAVPDRDIWRIDLKARNDEDRRPVRLISSTFPDDGPQYSPDATRIAFGSSRSGHKEIWVANADGSRAIQLTFFRGPESGSARWSPNGDEIVFDARPEGNADIYVIPAAGGQPRPIERHPATETQASWSRNGKWIYFGSNRSGEYQIWRVPAGGGPAVPMTHKGGYCAFDTSDGFLYYAKNRERTDLWRVPLQGGEETRVIGPLRFQSNFQTVGDALYYLTGPDSAGNVQLRRFRRGDQSERVAATIQLDLMHGLSVSSDERWALFTVNEQRPGDLVLVENLR